MNAWVSPINIHTIGTITFSWLTVATLGYYLFVQDMYYSIGPGVEDRLVRQAQNRGAVELPHVFTEWTATSLATGNELFEGKGRVVRVQ